MDIMDFIMAFEDGTATEEQIIEGFQGMINNGTVWKLQGTYGRTAQALIDAGHCSPADH